MTPERWTDMVGAYVLDALDSGERTAFEAQLAVDDDLRALVREARASTLLLAESLPDLEPPKELRDRVLSGMLAEAGGRAPSGGARGAVAQPSREERLRGTDADGSRNGGPRRVRAAAPWLLLAASVAGLFWLGTENRELAERSATLAEQLDAARASVGEAQAALAAFDSLALALSGPNVRLATLTGDTDPSLRLVWNRDRDLLLVAAQDLPPLPQGRTYQLWGIRGDEAPVGLGTFDVDPAGDALQTLVVAAGEDYDVSALTEEPAGGSPQPTTEPFLVGAWSGAQ